MLHDLGLLETYDQGRRFEVEGARAAREFLEGHAYPANKVDVVWDAIALHALPSIAEHKAHEVALVSIGAFADVVGLRIADVDPRFVHALLEQFPRLDFPNEWLRTLVEYVKKKPPRADGTILEGVGKVVETIFKNPLDTAY